MNKKTPSTNKGYWHIAIAVALAVGLFILGTINLESTPPLYWDEGWTLSVARNWVERGHYGRLLAGQPAPPGLEAAISVTGLVALSFYFFGVGVWQGRVVGVLFMLATLGTTYYFVRLLYDRSIAIGTLAVLLLLSMYPQLHPLFMGRTVFAEIPMLFYLLLGYTFFLVSYISTWFVLLASAFWGLALITKLQVVPFWTISLALSLLIMLSKRQWKMAGRLSVALGGSFLVSRWLLWFEEIILEGHTLPRTQLQGLYDFTALVPSVQIHVDALKTTLTVGIPTMLGLLYASWSRIKITEVPSHQFRDVVQISLILLADSWFAWYLFLSAGWTRYFFPAAFIASIFVAVMLRDLTDNFDFLSTMRRGASALRRSHFSRQNVWALLVIILTAWSLSITTKVIYHLYFVSPDGSAPEIAHFLNAQTPSNTLIETYESELFFLLNRRYHYPPDQIHVELNRRTFLGQDVPINYDPLIADPDYLVVGPQSKLWQLYDPVLTTGAFRLLRSYSRYDLYERIR